MLRRGRSACQGENLARAGAFGCEWAGRSDAAVPGEPKTILGDRRAKQVAAELLEPRTIFCWDEQVRVEIEALKMGLTGPGGGDPGGIGVAPGAKDASSGPSPERHAALDGGATDASQGQ